MFSNEHHLNCSKEKKARGEIILMGGSCWIIHGENTCPGEQIADQGFVQKYFDFVITHWWMDDLEFISILQPSSRMKNLLRSMDYRYLLGCKYFDRIARRNGLLYMQ